jgi:hypothetical protein
MRYKDCWIVIKSAVLWIVIINGFTYIPSGLPALHCRHLNTHCRDDLTPISMQQNAIGVYGDDINTDLTRPAFEHSVPTTHAPWTNLLLHPQSPSEPIPCYKRLLPKSSPLKMPCAEQLHQRKYEIAHPTHLPLNDLHRLCRSDRATDRRRTVGCIATVRLSTSTHQLRQQLSLQPRLQASIVRVIERGIEGTETDRTQTKRIITPCTRTIDISTITRFWTGFTFVVMEALVDC